MFGTANKDMGRDPDGSKFLYRVLRRLGLQFARRRVVRQEREMDENAFAVRPVLAELADCLEEWQPFNISDSSPDFAEHEVDFVFADRNEVLDLVCDVRNHLDRLAKVVASTLLLQDIGVNPASGNGIGRSRRDMGEAFRSGRDPDRFRHRRR